MRAGRSRRAACALLVVLSATPAAAAERERSWLLPDQAKVQLAGSIGFLSPGVGWAWSKRRLEGDLFLGWVPPALGGEDIWSVTGKLTWQPWELGSGRWRARPITGALQLTYTFGDDYYLFLPDRYPAAYYDFATALRAGVALGASVSRRLDRGVAREVGAYLELVAIDQMLFVWARNPETVGPEDAISLAIGARVAF